MADETRDLVEKEFKRLRDRLVDEYRLWERRHEIRADIATKRYVLGRLGAYLDIIELIDEMLQEPMTD